MLPSDIHFAAIWPTAHDGAARKVVVPLQCSFQEASKMVGSLASTQRTLPPGTSEIETLALGPFCVFSASASSPPGTLIVVGTKSWNVSSGVITFIRRVQADLSRDPAEFGFWQLRHLALRAEAVAAPGGDDTSSVMPPRLFEDDWDGEESESWEDEDMWSGSVDDDESAGAPVTSGDRSGAPSAEDRRETQRSSDIPAALSPWADSNAEAGASMLGDIKPANEVATGIPGYTQHTSKAPLNETSFTVEPSMTPQHQHHPHQLMTGTGLESVTVDRTTSGIEYSRGGGSPLGNAQQVPIPAATTAPPNLDVLLTSSEVRAEPAGRVSSGSAPDGDPGLPPPTAATPDLSALMTPAKEGQFDAGRENSNLVGAATLAVPRNGGGGTSTPDPTPQGDAGVAAGEANAPVTVSAAVSEDLAYSHRGSVLQSYAITGSVLVAAGAPARLRVTDPQGHIANATANAAVAEENATAVSMPPTREYSCKAGAVQPAGAPPKFVPTLLYRCSPAVQVLPVRVTCRLRKAGNAVLVWAQVIANPQLSQPLSGVSVLVNLPFSPQNKEGDVKSEPQATWKADSRMLQWVLPSEIKCGGKQVLQARLSMDEGQERVASIPQTAPAMVKCHLVDSTFSSVELEMTAIAEEGMQVAPGKIMKRCRVQCKQQG